MNTTEDTARRATVTFPSDTELLITREFDAPRSLVLEAITEPQHVREWYGLTDDALKVCDIDFRVGGKWHYVLAGPPGEDDISFSGEYLEIDTPDRFVSTESFDNMPGATYVVTITLTENDGRTTLQSHLVPLAGVARRARQPGMEYGMNISYNRLDRLLARLS